jgi:hypothetical protein
MSCLGANRAAAYYESIAGCDKSALARVPRGELQAYLVLRSRIGAAQAELRLFALAETD